MNDLDNNQAEINSALCCLMDFKRAYKEENGTITICDIRNLIDNIDFIEECVRKQKRVPATAERHFRFFGKMEWIKHCPSCGTMVNSKNGQKFCSICGQKFC